MAIGIYIICEQCKSVFLLTRGAYQDRMKVNKSGNLFCSDPCRRIYKSTLKPEDIKNGYEKRVIKRPEGCWGWKGKKHKFGYGRFVLQKKEYLAHRVSYEIYKGKLEPGLEIRHLCNNPVCSNPKHLEVGTHKQNMEDMVRSGRNKIGESHPNSSIDEKTAIRIKSLLSNKVKHKEISKITGASIDTIRSMSRARATWKHLKVILCYNSP